MTSSTGGGQIPWLPWSASRASVVQIASRRAVEALRAGVPNRDAVRHLGTDQQHIEVRFVNALSQIAAEHREGRQLPGFLIEGTFGSGKSHLLEWLQHLALEQGFVCSKVVISKETPPSDPHKVFRAAMESLSLPDASGGLDEVALNLDHRTESYAQLYQRVQNPAAGFDPLFQATLYLFERIRGDQEFLDKIVRFWGGDRLSIAEIKRQLRAVGQVPYDVKSRKIRDLALPRFRFAAELIAGAGYPGWVLLLDEVELVASLSLLARARSYAALAALTGMLLDANVPGTFTIACVTTEFNRVFYERGDQDRIPQRFGEREPALVAEAQAGMDLLASDSGSRLLIQAQKEEGLARTHSKMREIYAQGYDWTPPDDGVRALEASRTMRQYVREWITRWDLARLDPSYQPDIETEVLVPNLEERPELEQQSEPDLDDTDRG